jgi:FHS family L-fucose permease-like MFS transporter
MSQPIAIPPAGMPVDGGEPEPIVAGSKLLLYTIFSTYLVCGMTLCFESIFLPEFKEYFGLNYQQQMYTMLAKHIPFLAALGIGYLLQYVGYKNCLSLSMSMFSAGTLLLIPGLKSGRYSIVLAGFALIGFGFSLKLVAGNPMLTVLGPARGASSRLNFGNALGAVAQIIAPATLSFLLPVTAITVASKLLYIETIFLVLGVLLALVATVTLLAPNVDIAAGFRKGSSGIHHSSLWSEPRALLGFVTVFLIMGGEASLGGFYRNFLQDPNIVGLTARQSARLFTVYYVLFASGRLSAAWLQNRIRPATHLLIHLVGAALCLTGAVTLKGMPAAIAVTAIGFFVSIFFPTLYAIAVRNMGERTGQVSGLLTMGFLGSAVIPVLQGHLADRFGLQPAYAVGFLAYGVAAFYGLRYRKS